MSESFDPSPAALSPPLSAGVAPVILQDQVISPDGTFMFDAAGLEFLDHKAVPLCGLATALTGEWLLELLSKSAWVADHPGYRLCGPVLSPALTEILARLGRMDRYIALTTPTRFRAVVDLRLANRPAPRLKEAAEHLRSRALASATRIAILPQHATEKFSLANRASFAAWARAKRFVLLDPEAMLFDDLAHAMAAANFVMIADGRQTGLLTLCSPATRILEVASSGWRDATGRLLCDLFGLEWLPCEAGPPTYKLLTPLPFGARVPLSYEVPISGLAKLLQTL